MNPLIISQYTDKIHGIPRYAIELTKNNPSSNILRYNTPENTPPMLNGQTIQWKRPKNSVPIASGKFVKHPIKLRKLDADIYHAADPRETLPLWIAGRKPLVTTVHDLIVYKYPQTFERRWVYLSRLYLQFLNRSDRIIAVSESTKADAIEILNIPAKKIDVVHHGINDQFCVLPIEEIEVELEWPTVLMVGQPQPRKNHDRVAAAIADLHERGIYAHLYIVGAEDYQLDNLPPDGADIDDYLHATGYVSDEELVEYYNAANVVAVPSHYEGFGFPVLEGMACGTPVVTSNTSSLPEIAGNAAICVDPKSTEAIADGLEAVLTDDAKSRILVNRGKKHVSEFTWERTAKETRTVYKKVLYD